MRKEERVYKAAVALKQAHPGWGAGLIWVELAEQFEAGCLPSVRTLQRWFRGAGVQTRRAERTAQISVGRGQEAHEVWAMDAKEQIRLGDGSYASWLSITDEGSGAILSAVLFPQRRWTTIEPLAVKQILQDTKALWGRPQRLRLDNGLPWATQSPVPSALALWLVGLDVWPIYGRPARSTDNAIVERSHGVLAQWVEPSACPDFSSCQHRLAWAVDTQRNRYRSPNGYTRQQAFPALYTNPRCYAAQYDSDLFTPQRVITYLAQFHFRRKVQKHGQITLFASTYTVARPFVEVCLDPITLDWLITDDFGSPIRRFPNRELSYDLICHLLLGKRRKSTKPCCRFPYTTLHRSTKIASLQ